MSFLEARGQSLNKESTWNVDWPEKAVRPDTTEACPEGRGT